jgi:hypothetical protein
MKRLFILSAPNDIPNNLLKYCTRALNHPVQGSVSETVFPSVLRVLLGGVKPWLVGSPQNAEQHTTIWYRTDAGIPAKGVGN